MIDPNRTLSFMASSALTAAGWVAFAISLGAELAHLRVPAAHWLDLVVLWALIAAGLAHLAASVTRRWGHG